MTRDTDENRSATARRVVGRMCQTPRPTLDEACAAEGVSPRTYRCWCARGLPGAERPAGNTRTPRERAIDVLAGRTGESKDECARHWDAGCIWCSTHGWLAPGRAQLMRWQAVNRRRIGVCRVCHYALTKVRVPHGSGSRAATRRREWVDVGPPAAPRVRR